MPRSRKRPPAPGESAPAPARRNPHAQALASRSDLRGKVMDDAARPTKGGRRAGRQRLKSEPPPDDTAEP